MEVKETKEYKKGMFGFAKKPEIHPGVFSDKAIVVESIVEVSKEDIQSWSLKSNV